MSTKLRHLLLAHRWLGLLASLLIVILAITGILLNHTNELGLKQRTLSYGWLMDIYGIAPPSLESSFQVNQHWISSWDKQLFLDDHKLNLPKVDALHGAFETQSILVIVSDKRLTLITKEGELIDTLDYADSETLLRAGFFGGAVVLEFNGHTFAQTNDDLSALSPLDTPPSPIIWAIQNRLPPALKSTIEDGHGGDGITLERVLLDLHSGRIAKLAGVYLMDAVALILLFLVISAWTLLGLRQRKRHARRDP